MSATETVRNDDASGEIRLRGNNRPSFPLASGLAASLFLLLPSVQRSCLGRGPRSRHPQERGVATSLPLPQVLSGLRSGRSNYRRLVHTGAIRLSRCVLSPDIRCPDRKLLCCHGNVCWSLFLRELLPFFAGNKLPKQCGVGVLELPKLARRLWVLPALAVGVGSGHAGAVVLRHGLAVRTV